MDAVLRQSKSMCPFLKKTSPATLRALSTSARHASPCGGSMSNLQTIARRCPVMGKAMAVQTAQAGKMGLGGVAAMGAMRSFTGKTGRARLHTSRAHEARPMEDTIFGREKSTLKLPAIDKSYPANRISPSSAASQAHHYCSSSTGSQV